MELKSHSPFALPDEPDFENNGFKWWGVKSDAPKGTQAAYVEMPTGEANYVLFDKVGVFYETKSLEALGVRAFAEKMRKRK